MPNPYAEAEYGQDEHLGHSDELWWEGAGSEGAAPKDSRFPAFSTESVPDPLGLSEDGRGYLAPEGGSGYGQDASGFGGQHGAPAAVEPGGSFGDVQAPPAGGRRIGYAADDQVSALGSDEGHDGLSVSDLSSDGGHDGFPVLPPASAFGGDSGFGRPGGLTPRQPVVGEGGLTPRQPVDGEGGLTPRQPVVGDGGLAGEPPLVSVEGRSPSFGSGVTDPTGTASEGIHEDVLSDDGVVWRESPERTVKVEEAPSVAEPHSAVVKGGGSSAVTRPGEVRTDVSAAEHGAWDDGARRSLPGRTAEVEEAPSVAEPVTEGAVQQLPQEDRSVQAWLDQVVDDSGSGVGVPLPGQTYGAGEQGLPLGSGRQTEPHQPLAGTAPQQIGSGIRTAGAAPRSGSAVEGVSAGAEPPVTGDVQTGRDEVGGLARLEGSEPVPPAPPSRGVPVVQEPRGVSETAPESRTANSSSVRHGGPSDGGR
ncbi:hypothetical protein AB0L95_42155, partial [Streptomyces sp. NPDC052036]